MKETVFAVVAHPDDIEFMMAGTLLALGQKGYQLHYMNVANGSCGSVRTNAEETIVVVGLRQFEMRVLLVPPLGFLALNVESGPLTSHLSRKSDGDHLYG